MIDKILIDKLKFYKENSRAVHIIKKDLRFHNGVISELKADFLIFDDERTKETVIFLEEIKDVEPREPKIK